MDVLTGLGLCLDTKGSLFRGERLTRGGTLADEFGDWRAAEFGFRGEMAPLDDVVVSIAPNAVFSFLFFVLSLPYFSLLVLLAVNFACLDSGLKKD